MALEQINEDYFKFSPGPIDPHTHPRVFDEEKAGLSRFTEVALSSGIVAMLAMPNESVRRADPFIEGVDKTILVPYPIASLDRVLPMEAAIAGQAVIPTGIIFGLDPKTIFRDMYNKRLNAGLLVNEFEKVNEECVALKVYLAKTTGGNEIALEFAPKVVQLWHEHNPDKPVIFHVEGEDVATLLSSIEKLPGDSGKEIPIHIAHVSSRQELEAVIEAKKRGMNVTCEVTPHHLFLSDDLLVELRGDGCVKPGLKSKENIEYLRANMNHVDAIASDCAPHRLIDKESDNPAFGMANHTLMVPLLVGAVKKDNWLTMDDIYQKMCIAPRKIFNIPIDDGSLIEVSTLQQRDLVWYENKAQYGVNPFNGLKNPPMLIGDIVLARTATGSEYSYEDGLKNVKRGVENLIRPGNYSQKSTEKNVDKA